jgi:DNA-binding transcriptional regulator LsrR (DeoR family)
VKEDKMKLLSQVAYMYFVEDKSQSEISEQLGIYRTTISRMLKEAKEKQIVEVKIANFDTKVYSLEQRFRERFGLKFISIAPANSEDTELEKDERLAKAGAAFMKQRITPHSLVGVSWGSTLARTISMIENKKNTHSNFVPVVGGPSYINTKYHVNTLVYELARKFGGTSHFVNATVVQETKELKEGIVQSKYFADLIGSWSKLDIAIVGIGGKLSSKDSQWRDLLTKSDYEDLKLCEAVGDCCCRFFDADGKIIKSSLYERTIGINLEDLKQVPISVGIARAKPKAILAMLKKGYINSLITDEETALEILRLAKDSYVQHYLELYPTT